MSNRNWGLVRRAQERSWFDHKEARRELPEESKTKAALMGIKEGICTHCPDGVVRTVLRISPTGYVAFEGETVQYHFETLTPSS